MRRTVWLAVALLHLTKLHGLEASTLIQEERPRAPLGEVHRVPGPSTSLIEHFRCTVTKVLPDRVLMIKDEETKSFRFLEVPPTASLKAKKKADFGGRRKLEFEDLAVGHQIKVTYTIATGEISKIQVLGKVAEPQ